MPYGLPCPETAQPEQVFPLVASADNALGEFVGAIEQALTTLLFAAQAGINQSIGALSDWVQRQLTNTNKSVGKVWDALQAEFHSVNFAGTVSLATAIQDIATTLQTTQEEVINGPALPSPLAPTLPAFAIPSAPSAPPAPPPIALPGAPPQYPGTGTQPPTCTQPRRTLTVRGAPTTATPLCYPVVLPDTVTLGGVEYDPQFTAYYTGAPLGVSPDGTPTLPISYDLQPDGSMVVNVGPISIHMRLPSSTPGQPDAACNAQPG